MAQLVLPDLWAPGERRSTIYAKTNERTAGANMIRQLKQYAATALVGIGLVMSLPTTVLAVPIDSTAPTWSNVVGGSNILLNAANGAFTDVRWGASTGSGQSGLGFDPTNPPSADVAVGATFLLGTLRHYNNPIAGGSAASAVDLALLTSITGATPTTQTFSFRFFIDETPNVTPCAYPSTTPCSDRITFQNLDLTSAFLFEGVAYTIELFGFSSNGGESFSTSFISQEGGTNSIGLYGRITAAAQVPEPGTLALLALGLIGLASVRRRVQ